MHLFIFSPSLKRGDDGELQFSASFFGTYSKIVAGRHIFVTHIQVWRRNGGFGCADNLPDNLRQTCTWTEPHHTRPHAARAFSSMGCGSSVPAASGTGSIRVAQEPPLATARASFEHDNDHQTSAQTTTSSKPRQSPIVEENFWHTTDASSFTEDTAAKDAECSPELKETDSRGQEPLALIASPREEEAMREPSPNNRPEFRRPRLSSQLEATKIPSPVSRRRISREDGSLMQAQFSTLLHGKHSVPLLRDQLGSRPSPPRRASKTLSALTSGEHVGCFSCHGVEPIFTRNEITATAKINQDCACMVSPVGKGANAALFCVFDGHGEFGTEVAAHAMHSLRYVLTHGSPALLPNEKSPTSEFEMSPCSTNSLEDDPASALVAAFEGVQAELSALANMKTPSKQANDSGTCATAAFLRDGILWVAGAGDCTCILGSTVSPSPSLSALSSAPTVQAAPLQEDANESREPSFNNKPDFRRRRLSKEFPEQEFSDEGSQDGGRRPSEKKAEMQTEGTESRWVAKQLTTDHKCDSPIEKARIESLGGWVRPAEYEDGELVAPARIYEDQNNRMKGPGLAMSRCLGDLEAMKV